MEPLAIAGYMLIATAFLEGAMVGAFAGAIARAFRWSLFWVGPLVATVHVAAEAILLGTYSPKAAVVFGLPPLVLCLLVSWLITRWLEAKWRRLWAALAGIVCAFALALVWGLLFRLGIWVPVVCALAADVMLVMVLLFLYLARRRKPVATPAAPPSL